GDPAGIGPDICIKQALRPPQTPWVAIGDPVALRARATSMGLPLTISEWRPGARCSGDGHLAISSVPTRVPVTPGMPNPANGEHVLTTLRAAVHGIQSGIYSAMTTGPVSKAVINDSGTPFSGHTEFLAELAGGYPVMMLATPGLRVALATTHLPLRAVADAITAEVLTRVITIIDRDFRERFGLQAARILVCGLNPHAGESGHLGREEIEVLIPTLDKLRARGINLIGPLPADTLFNPDRLRQADAVLAMYHDQGLPVLKFKGFGKAVNVTLGLPIIRTSVDHGTAFELAATGKADDGSLDYAIEVAATMVHQGKKA
ncbi:MAG: 4-hydroxythreonine-4-phosphate dehydrogenase PdxA, partial [Gammaproteobacteria bacterium]